MRKDFISKNINLAHISFFTEKNSLKDKISGNMLNLNKYLSDYWRFY